VIVNVIEFWVWLWRLPWASAGGERAFAHPRNRD